jgi:hypothetical protein
MSSCQQLWTVEGRQAEIRSSVRSACYILRKCYGFLENVIESGTYNTMLNE